MNRLGIFLVFGLSVAIPSACANLTYKGLRTSEPTTVQLFNGEYRAFAECLDGRLNDILPRHLSFNQENRTAVLLADHNDWITRFHLLIQGKGRGQVLLTLRQSNTYKTSEDKTNILNAAGECAKLMDGKIP